MASAGLRYLLVAFVFLIRLITANVPSDTKILTGNVAGSNLTVSINVPANSDNDLFFHFLAPAGQSWAGFGLGQVMRGSLLFIVYPSEDRKNVTVSPRIAVDHSPQQATKDVNVTLFEGTGIVDGNYVVNARCTGCRRWSAGGVDGSVDVKSAAQPFIYAVGADDDDARFLSNDVNRPIQKHELNGVFSLDMVKATGDGGVPVVQPGQGSISSVSGDSSSFSIKVHAFFLIVAFLVVFPLGYLFLRLFERVWIHMIVQTFGLMLVLVGFILGVVISKRQNISPKLNHPHQVIGFIVFILTLAAWTLGLVGHQLFKKKGIPTIPIKVHRAVGPAAIMFGLTNVGTGFNFADNRRRLIPFYIATFGVFLFVSGIILLSKRRKMKRAALQTPAAQNFNNAWYNGNPKPPPPYSAAPGYQQQDVPMQTFQLPAHGRPNSTVHPGNRVFP